MAAMEDAFRLTPDNYVHVLSAESYRPFACRAKTKEEFEAWQRDFRPYLWKLLGINRISARCSGDPQAQQVGVEELDDHVREEWKLETEPGFWVPFYLLRPKSQQGPLPLVITPHGHGKAAKKTYAGIWETEEERESIEAGERDVALQAVREGYVAIAPDMRGFADLRRQAEIAKDANNSCRTMQMHAYMFGRTLIGERVWDVMRLIDYAKTRPEIDTSRVAVTGNSGGGTVSLFAGACDERITVCVPSSYFCTFEHSIGSIRHCECNYVPGLMAVAEMYDVASLIAPRAFLAVAGRTDPIFPHEATEIAFKKVQEAYTVAGVSERCELYTGDGGHRYYKAGVWPFMHRWLAQS
jgi:dienelactone hydrolase